MWAPVEKVSRFLSSRANAGRERNGKLQFMQPESTATEQLTRDLARTRQFTAMVAHEMRNLMAPLVYGAELLGRSDDRATTLRVRHDILVSVATLRRLVEDLLTSSGCDAAHMSLVKTIVDLRDVVSTSVDLVRPMFPTRGHLVDVLHDEDAPVMVNGDFCRLTQVITNLVINAAKFTPEDGDILIVLARDAAEATITVKDSGIGIHPDQMAHIFEAFNRGNEDPGDTAEGLGLGLCIARKLIELHGGRLTGFSAGKGEGSEFMIRLPLALPS